MKLGCLASVGTHNTVLKQQPGARAHSTCVHAFTLARPRQVLTARHTYCHKFRPLTGLAAITHTACAQQPGHAWCQLAAAIAGAAETSSACEQQQARQQPPPQLLLLLLGQAAAVVAACLSAAARRLATAPAVAAAAAATLSNSSAAATAAQENASGMFRQLRMLALVVPFAQVSSGGFQANVWMPFWQALFGFTHFYLFILFMRVLLSWFPALDWSRNPWLVIKVITDPYLNVFRNLIPALFMAIDLTPLLGFMLLQDFVAILENCVVENLFSDTIDEPTSDPFIYMPQDYSRFTPTKPA